MFRPLSGFSFWPFLPKGDFRFFIHKAKHEEKTRAFPSNCFLFLLDLFYPRGSEGDITTRGMVSGNVTSFHDVTYYTKAFVDRSHFKEQYYFANLDLLTIGLQSLLQVLFLYEALCISNCEFSTKTQAEAFQFSIVRLGWERGQEGYSTIYYTTEKG